MDTDPHDLRAPRKTGSRMKAQEDVARPRPAVCRRLFPSEPGDRDDGGVDNMFNQITEAIDRNLDEAAKRYNFDFRTEEPLEGDWTWERITPETPAAPASAPAALAEPPVCEDTPTAPEESQSSDLRHPSVPQ